MKKYTSILILFISSSIFASNAFSATSEITWTEPETYSDVKDSDGFDAQFREETFNTLEKHFTKLASTLPENQTLKINVTNLDLAGDTRIAGVRDIRVIKEGYPPAIHFSYRLEGADGSVIQSAEVKLRDMGFMMVSTLRYRNESLGYEKKMLDDWFGKAFKNFIVKT